MDKLGDLTIKGLCVIQLVSQSSQCVKRLQKRFQSLKTAIDTNTKRLFLDIVYVQGLTLKNKWEVHGGESKEREDLLFTVQQSQAVSLKTSVDVFLPENNNVKKSNTCDFHASGGYSNISFKVFKSDALIAGVGVKKVTNTFI